MNEHNLNDMLNIPGDTIGNTDAGGMVKLTLPPGEKTVVHLVTGGADCIYDIRVQPSVFGPPPILKRLELVDDDDNVLYGPSRHSVYFRTGPWEAPPSTHPGIVPAEPPEVDTYQHLRLVFEAAGTEETEISPQCVVTLNCSFESAENAPARNGVIMAFDLEGTGELVFGEWTPFEE